jgi:signal transduction histidine kinase
LVGLWLRPLLADVDRITSAARAFAADYRTPLKTAAKTTELKSLAADLDEMSARLSNLIQTQKELIAALSHEMRTPLARIRFALAVIDRKSDSELAGRIDALNADVQEIDDLIATMLNYARLDHPDLEMHWQDVPLAAWLAQATQKYACDEKNLSTHHDEAPDSLRMDPRLMTLAISSLLSNAVRYAKSEVCVSISGRDGRVELAVEDDGPGIPEDDRESVFKAFTRLDDSRNRETGGYGLGLAIVARIAALHGGSARVESSQRLGGAAFVLAWPT